ncbi:hypothetical protein SAMN06266787_1286 [Halorubrum ezzemoulense]|uniref:EamA family transporter n=1 Tax=Halorubrum ezzemoulense TaxID=337243 RepID=A0A238Z505_HALEZ|nr:hypothetical protein SAMN06266787_1286 [Halorubrum ezzemoulense]
MSRYRTADCFLLLCAVWGTAFMATDVGLVNLPAVPFTAVRFDVAAVLLFAAVLVSGTDFHPRTLLVSVSPSLTNSFVYL